MDDPLLTFKGSDSTRLRLFAVAFLWFEAAGYPVAWHKISHGDSVDWIGGRLERRDTGVVVSIPESKALSLASRSDEMLFEATITLRELRSYAGAVSFVAGIIPHLRPFLGACWAAIAASKKGPRNDLQSLERYAPMAKKRRLPHSMVFVRQIHHALSWIKAFFEGTEGSIVRLFEFHPLQSPFSIATDASPWGMEASFTCTDILRNISLTSYEA